MNASTTAASTSVDADAHSLDDSGGAVPGLTRPAPSVGRAWTMVLLLTLLNITAFVDRYVMTLLVSDLHREFGMSDVQFGILVGPAFIVTYAIVLFPVASLVDRWNRQHLILAGVILWSAMTLATAFATSYTQLLVFRAGLAVGEAIVSPAAISLIGDLFVPAKRRLPMIIVVAGAQLGVAAAALFGALTLSLAARYGAQVPAWLPNTPWRLVFVAVGLLPLAVGAIYFLTAREPARGAYDAPSQGTIRDKATSSDHVRSHWPLYAMAALVTSCTALVGTAIPVWGPTFVHRNFGVSAASAGYALGTAFMIASFSGVMAFPLALKLLARFREVTRAMVLVCFVGLLCALPAFLFACLTTSFPTAVVAFGFATFMLALTFPLTTQIVQVHTPAPIRARVGAAMLLVLFFVASGVGPVVVPWTAKLLGRAEALGPPLMIVAVIGTAIGLLLCVLLDRWLSRSSDVGEQPLSRH